MSEIGMSTLRRQLSLFLPEPERSMVDDVRLRIDPKQHALIPAHVTLCREDELPPWDVIRSRLVQWQGQVIALSFAAPRRLPDGCVLLPVAGSTQDFDAARRFVLGPACRSHVPHITLLHPRHAHGFLLDLESFDVASFPSRIRFREISAIEQRDGGAWTIVERFGFDARA